MSTDLQDLVLNQCPFVAFDLETTGGYPVGHEIVEFAAVKCQQGQIIDTMHFLFKPKEAMSEFIIGIHGITNEMVQNSPAIETCIQDIHHFLKGSIAVAHHAPFDMGFLTYEFEKSKLDLFFPKALCTSLLSRKLIHGSKNHKLQTLIPFLGLNPGTAHRALDDAKACLGILNACLEKLGPDALLKNAYQCQEKDLNWVNYSLLNHADYNLQQVLHAIQHKQDLNIIYQSGRSKGLLQKVKPLGVVRSPDGDYMSANCYADGKKKRYYLSSLSEAESLSVS